MHLRVVLLLQDVQKRSVLRNKGSRTVPLPDELAVARLAPGHVVVAFHGPARLAPAVADHRSHAFRGVGRLLPVMAMQRVDEPIAGFDHGVVLVSIGD